MMSFIVSEAGWELPACPKLFGIGKDAAPTFTGKPAAQHLYG
ncbi:hypothetical protein [Flavobacterium sp. 3HN19-14]